MAGFSSITGDEAIMYADNSSFDGTQRGGKMTTDGQLWIGSTASNRPNNGGHVRLGSITSPSGSITIGYSAPNITLDLAGGGAAIDSIAVDVTTGAGTNPVVPTAAGLVTFTGGQYPTGTFGTRVISIVSTAANTLSVQAQISTESATPLITNNGVCHFDSAIFTVDPTGFVSAPNAGYISLSPFIVGTDVHSGYSTIAAGIAAAVSAGASASTPQTVWIKPKTNGTAYVENITLADGVHLSSINFWGKATLQGTITATNATASITGMTITDNGASFLVLTGTSNITCINCFLFTSSSTGITLANTSNLTLLNCQGGTASNNLFFAITGTDTTSPYNGLIIDDCFFGNNDETVLSSTISAGQLRISNSYIPFPITTSGTSSFRAISSTFETGYLTGPPTTLTIGGSGANSIEQCSVISGTSAAASISATLTVSGCSINSSNANTLTGAGTMRYGKIVFTGSSSGTNVSTQTPLATLN